MSERFDKARSGGDTGRGDAVIRDSDTPVLLNRFLAWFVLVLMALAAVYTGWIAVANYHRIGV
jgi:hypothetical protein